MFRPLGVLLALSLALPGQAQDRSKKAYELMYEDIQLLKVQMERIEKRLDRTAVDLKTIGDLVRDLVAQFKDYQTLQARSQEGLREVPPQVRALQVQLSQIENRILLIAEDVQALKSAGPAPAETADSGKPDPGEKTPAEKKPGGEPAIKPPPLSGLSAQEAYQAALADYDKGNYDLAVDGFALYREQFPASPLADDALYMMGESRFSQKKYQTAVEIFDDLILTYPSGNKIAAAYLKKGYALAEMHKKPEAIAVLRLLISKYSMEEEAGRAQQKIKELQEIK